MTAAATYLRETAERLGFTGSEKFHSTRKFTPDWAASLGDTRPARGDGPLVLLLVVHEPWQSMQVPLDKRVGHWCTISITHAKTGLALPMRHPLIPDAEWEAPIEALDMLEQLRLDLLALPIEWAKVRSAKHLGEYKPHVMGLLSKLPAAAAKHERAACRAYRAELRELAENSRPYDCGCSKAEKAAWVREWTATRFPWTKKAKQ